MHNLVNKLTVERKVRGIGHSNNGVRMSMRNVFHVLFATICSNETDWLAKSSGSSCVVLTSGSDSDMGVLVLPLSKSLCFSELIVRQNHRAE